MPVNVKDVMTRRVISVGEDACFKDIAELLITHAVSAVPVLDSDGHVTGVVSEADLLHKEEGRKRFHGASCPPPQTGPDQGPEAGKARGKVARELMTAPAVTVSMDVPVAAAGRLMEHHGVKRLPVLDGHGHLAGIVSRHDLLKVFARADRDIEREVRVEVLVRSLWMDTSRVQVTVQDGVVTLSGRMILHRDAQIAVWMTRQVDGVVDVVDELAWDRDDTPVGERD
ncbi:CBS domain-containing protein [Streptosporangium roseum]|uniref:CBS domain containing membrane protein n=1 Tax=Streptosporangium roseum (strain ATCC 12428 / DSM 43021 / JCM 3005 / KCTC 9067 / NCIMB 10171 / NRRL 2505 / NI 9100) TaxID=479432 RepID=D2B5B3_STRRD|nr:CBS domain-containing protein [Streptosporangium roseum]ACZ87637.1 CBS domain containing membrane protein [Streptosporangium roseum DSM 43021]